MTKSQLETIWNLGKLGIVAASTALSVLATSQAQAQVAPVTPNPQGSTPETRVRAQKLFQALTSVRVPIDDSRVIQMEDLIKEGNVRGAAAIATQDSLFLDVLVRDVGRKMATRDETVRAPMSDFVATWIGVIRDSDTTSAKELLTGNFYYRVDPAVIATLPTNATVRQDETADILSSNNHYNDLTARGLSPKTVLIRQSPQRAFNNGGAVIDHPDPAGLITTRAFVEAHAVAGTNRRMVEYSFRQFMCVSMDEWADANNPDDRVSQDVTRTPSGSVNLYQTTCKACHSGMDGLRSAFAFLDFNGNQQRIQTNVLNKMTRNATEFPAGYRISDNGIVNYATQGKNADNLGFRGALVGNGISAFGKMIADSRGFSRCMVRKAFKAVCRRPALAQEETLIRSLADQFEVDGYHMRHMFENVAVQPQCIQQ